MIWILQIPVCFGNESVVCKYFKVQTVLLQEQFHILMTAALNAKAYRSCTFSRLL